MELIDKLSRIGDAVRIASGESKKYTLDEMARMVMSMALPSDYVAVDGLYNNGKQYNTGVKDIFGTWTIDVKWDPSHITERQLIGYSASSNAYFGVMNGNYVMAWSDTGIKASTDSYDRITHTLSVLGSKYYEKLNDSTKELDSYGNAGTAFSIGTITDNPGNLKCYAWFGAVKFTPTGSTSPTYHIVPVKQLSTNKLGYYNVIAKTFTEMVGWTE